MTKVKMKNEETQMFTIFTTDGNFHEFVPEAEADTAKGIFAEYLRLSEENKHIRYLIMCPDGQIRTAGDLIEKYIHPPKKMHEKIPGDTEIWEYDGTSSATVYLGWLDDMETADVKWNITDDSRKTAEIAGGWPMFITLDEIAAQFPCEQIIVIIDNPLSGEIWYYEGSHSPWVRIGITGGYA